MMFKFIFKIGQKLRNPSLQKCYDFLKKSESWTLEQLEDYQLKKLKEIINVAYFNTVYYKSKFDLAKVHPSDLKDLNDLKKFPILTKKEIIENVKNNHSNLKFKKLFSASTSGTTGQSLNFKRDENADSFNRASIFRGYSWHRVQPWERSGYFWGYNFNYLQKLKILVGDVLVNRFRLFKYDIKSVKKFIKKSKKAVYITGYASMIYQVAKIINTNKLNKPKNLKMIVGTSEKIFESYQSEVKKAFDLKIINEYGATETGIIAFECPYGKMHINMEGVIVEEIDNEIIVTNLQMLSFPVIRYKLGDFIKLSSRNLKCKCGKNHLILDDVMGRIGNVVYGFKSTYPSLVFYYIFKNLANQNKLLLTYQVVQNKKGELNFLIVQKLNKAQLIMLENEIKKYFKKDIKFEIWDSYNLAIGKKKTQNFISKIK